ncbi:DUF3560 domain-containing protein [Acidisarcina polymorpha]|uniref:DUF3560 domain-containing protein n=1 Tax=Acidisarcina polymorpha TaxID=2211140 RepID=UPI00191BE9A9|nr:DUF3560 domain-containing protein [Acidisarcina polymorpha]
MKAAGFIWAPKQDLFVAPMWTHSREDLLIELAGEIEDEDRSLVDRAEERADRFSDYKESRIEDAQRAHDAVHRIADNIPFGQPILVGHHSERHARKDAERIENGMRKTVQMWQTARYWEQRAAGALHHAKYKALPGVRHRRIKGLEADKRKQERNKQEAEMWLKLWTKCANEPDKELQAKVALRIAAMCHLHMPRKEGDREDFQHTPSAYDALQGSFPTLYLPRTLDEVLAVALETYPRVIPTYDRWIDHYTNRIAYEKAMLGETGGLAADRFNFEVGGKVFIGDEWLVILKINKTGDAISSLTTTPRRYFYGSKYKAGIESVKDYQAPKPEETAAVKAASKLPPDVQLSRRRLQTHDDRRMEAKEDVRRSTVYDSRRDRYPRSVPHPLDMGRKLEDRFCLSHRRQAYRPTPEASSVDPSGAHRPRDACNDGARPEGTKPSPDAAHTAPA